jgi:hypothetical protein
LFLIQIACPVDIDGILAWLNFVYSHISCKMIPEYRIFEGPWILSVSVENWQRCSECFG